MFVYQGTWPFLSALALQYPKKPIELADDLESFVYVILYMALRWHRHKMSPPSSVEGLPEEELIKINGSNNLLAVRVYNLFCESWDREDGYEGGGDYKRIHIEIGKVPVERENGPDGQRTPLALLLDRLYKLLHIHYLSLDREALQKFSVKQLDDGSEKRPLDSAEGLSSASAPSPEPPTWELEHAITGNLYTELGDRADGVGITRPNPGAFEPVLNDHRRIVRAFALAFIDEDGQDRPGLRNYEKKDKFVDQFLGLQALLGVMPKRCSTKRPMEPDVRLETVPKR